MALLDVNGPEGVSREREPAVPEWDAIVWRPRERYVRRMRQKIFAAAQDADIAKVRNLQKLLLASWSNTLVSVRLVTSMHVHDRWSRPRIWSSCPRPRRADEHLTRRVFRPDQPAALHSPRPMPAFPT